MNRKNENDITVEKRDDFGTSFYISPVFCYLRKYLKSGDYPKSIILAWY